MIRKAEISDAAAITRIYNHYIATSAITFDIDEFPEEVFAQRISLAYAEGYPFWVYDLRGEVVGYCLLSKWKPKKAYEFSAEVSVYVDQQYVGRGFGGELMRHLLTLVDTDRFHTLISGIVQPNDRSVALHEKLGFKQISLMREIGRKFDLWHDVGYWQLIMSKYQPKTDSSSSTEQSCPCGANDYCRCH